MLVCLYFGVNYLKGKDFFSSDRVYYSMFDQTRGLQTSAPVLLRGVKIGSVSDIALNGEQHDKVVVTVNIKRSITIPDDSHLKLFSDGLMGGMSIELVKGTSEVVFRPGAYIPSDIESGLLDIASISLEELVAEATTMMNSLEATAGSLNEILVRNRDGLEGIVSNVETVTGKLSDAKLDVMLGDLGTFTAMLRDNSGRFEQLLGNLEQTTGQIAGADLRSTLDTLGMGISRLNTVLGKLSDGEGSAARLLDDPALYDSLTLATGNLAALLEDLRANPKRYVHFSLFGNRDRSK